MLGVCIPEEVSVMATGFGTVEPPESNGSQGCKGACGHPSLCRGIHPSKWIKFSGEFKEFRAINTLKLKRWGWNRYFSNNLYLMQPSYINNPVPFDKPVLIANQYQAQRGISVSPPVSPVSVLCMYVRMSRSYRSQFYSFWPGIWCTSFLY